MPRTAYQFINPYEETVRRLKRELDEARYTIISLMPDELEKILWSFHSCKSRDEARCWGNTAAEKIIESAEILPPQGYYLSDRAYCPLCGRGSNSPFPQEKGFSVPEGLRRHLVGWGDRGNQCDVFGTAMRLARDHWHEKFHEQEEAEEAEKKARTLERKKTETLYRIAPNEEPKLIKDGLYSAAPRNTDEWAWAEERLADLGFQVSQEGNVKSYVSEMEDFVVYADPRANGEIKFTVYKKPLPKRSRKGSCGNFYLKDNWKNDIRGKYESRLAAATARLPAASKLIHRHPYNHAGPRAPPRQVGIFLSAARRASLLRRPQTDRRGRPSLLHCRS